MRFDLASLSSVWTFFSIVS